MTWHQSIGCREDAVKLRGRKDIRYKGIVASGPFRDGNRRLIAHGIEKQGKLPQDIDSTRSRTQSCHRPLGAPRVNQFGREDRSL